jgi:hypothetical protein
MNEEESIEWGRIGRILTHLWVHLILKAKMRINKLICLDEMEKWRLHKLLCKVVIYLLLAIREYRARI